MAAAAAAMETLKRKILLVRRVDLSRFKRPPILSLSCRFTTS
jgi:hypothetical protein